MNTALVLLDAQNSFFTAENANLPAFEATVPVINRAIGHFRAASITPIFIQHTSERQPVGSQPWAISERFDCRPIDTRMNKSAQNAFWNTGLDALLRSQRAGRVIIAGYIAERCVLSTLRGAAERGYEGVLLEGGIASLDNRYTQFTLEISPHITVEALQTLLEEG